MAGYTKQDTTGKIANGNIVDADDFNDEFNTLQTAFGSTGGHDHSDTSSGNGAPITKAGADHRYEFGDDALIPKNSFTSIDVGSSTRKFDNAHFGGKVNSATLETTGAATLNSLVVGTSTAVTAVDTDLASVAGTDTTLASAKAIKTYVDAQITAEDLDVTADSGTIAIDLDSAALTIAGGTGITTSADTSTVTITSDDANINHDALNNFVADEHIGHSGVTITAGNGLTGGGNITATRTLTVDPHTGIAVTSDGVALSHLGIEDLADPNADRVAFWDDSASKFDWLTMGTNLAITGTTLNATDTNDNTTYTAGTGLTLSGTTFNANVEGTEQTVAAQTVTATASRSYAVQVDGSDNLIVNVPWVDTNTDTNTTYSAGTGLTLDGTTFNVTVTDTTYTAGTDLDLTGTTFSLESTLNNVTDMVVTGDFTVNSSGAVVLDSETNTVLFKNGSGGDTVTHTLYDNYNTSPWSHVSHPTGGNYSPDYKISSLNGIELNAGNDRGSGVFITDNLDTSSNGGYPFLTIARKFETFSAGDKCGEIIVESIASNGNSTSTVRPELRIVTESNTSYSTTETNSSGKVRFFVNSEGYTSGNMLQPLITLDGAGTSTFQGINNVLLTTYESGGDIKLKAGTVTIEKEDDATKAATISIDANSIVTVDGALGYRFKTGQATNNNFVIETTNSSSNVGSIDSRTTPDLTLFSNSQVSYNDLLGTIEWDAKNSANSEVTFADIHCQVYSNTNNDEGCNLYINSTYEGTLYTGVGVLYGGVRLYYEDVQKLETSTAGISVTGALAVSGALSKGSGSFKIDHPLPAKADTHHLVHSFIEGPQADLIYRGRVALVDSTATVDIDIAAGMTDGTFVALCEDVQCFTSNESGWAAVKGSVSGNTLTITAQDNACTDTISWMVVGERKDPHMLDAATDWTDSQGKVIVEPAKPAE
jgi:hypothetical protein